MAHQALRALLVVALLLGLNVFEAPGVAAQDDGQDPLVEWAATEGTGKIASAGGRLAGGAAHTCAVLDNGFVHCWGGGFFDLGRVGLGLTYDPPRGVVLLDRPATEVAAGVFHSCALLDNGSVQCWGA